ncbi:MAG: hypothetical protein KJ600_03935 [Nanoarchaeota archaeon]|nr:hypothetical protein [Nanoarchaeota archaeon]MBU1103678.1 hypothetical protein [Nanoarchaeota archaeon]
MRYRLYNEILSTNKNNRRFIDAQDKPNTEYWAAARKIVASLMRAWLESGKNPFRKPETFDLKDMADNPAQQSL